MDDLRSATSETMHRDMLLKLWKGKFIILAAILIATAISMIHYFTSTPVFSAQAVIMVKSPEKEKIIQEGGAVGEAASRETDIELIKSYPLAAEAVKTLLNTSLSDRLEIFKGQPTKPVNDKVIRPFAESLQGSIFAENIRGTNLITVSVDSPNPNEAALLANTICQTYQKKDTEWNAVQDIALSKTIEQQLEEQKAKVDAIEQDLAEFMRSQKVYEATGSVADLQREFSAAETQYNTNKVQADILGKQLAYVEQILSREERQFAQNMTSDISSQLKSIDRNIAAQESAYINLALQKGSDDPEVRSAFQQLNATRSEYNQVVRKKIAGELASAGNAEKYRFDLIATKLQANMRLAELNNNAGEYLKLKSYYQERLNKLPQKQITYARLKLDQDVANRTYAFLKEKLDEARIKVASNSGRIVILKPAMAPSGPESPDIMKNLLIGIFGGLFLGIGAIWGKEMLK